MNRILMDLTDLKDEEQQQAGLGIKLFRNKKKEVGLYLLGKEENLLTINSLEGINIIKAKEEEKEEALDRLFSLSKEKECRVTWATNRSLSRTWRS